MCRFRRASGIALLFAASFASCSFAAQMLPVKTQTKSIAVFKNGLGFFMRDAEATLTDGWAVSDIVPPAALGTFWIGSSKPGVTIERLISTQEDISREIAAITVQEIIEANVGKQMRFTVGDKVIDGKLISIPEDRMPNIDSPTYPVYTSMIPYSRTQLALIETSTGTLAINKNSITSVESGDGLKINRTVKETVKRLKFKVSGAKDKAPINIGYLQKGVSWSPAYLIELIDGSKARVTMQGLLVNDVEDIDGSDIYFVVGYPNFIFADTVSPLALTQSVSDFLQGVTNGRGASYNAGIASQFANTSSSFGREFYDSGPMPTPEQNFGYSSTKDTPGAPEEDLFLYGMKNVSLKKGERAYYTVFSADIPYEHVYEWSVPNTSNVLPNGYLDNSNQSKVIENQVWHKLSFTNTSKFPFTTAPAMAMSNGQPLAQDTLKYTAKGGKGDVRVTVATDIGASKSEVEKSRERSNYLGSSRIKVSSEGKLWLKNYKTRAVTISVNKTLVGEVSSADNSGVATKTSEGIQSFNPISIIKWEVPLAPGEEKTLTYNYSTYIRD